MPEYPWIIYRMSEGPLTTKEVHQGVNEQLNRKLGTDWGYSEYEWANLLQGFRPLPIRTASGTIAHFSDGADDVPMKSVVVNITPVQDLHGYSRQWAGGFGKNLFDIDGWLTSLSQDYTKNDNTYTIANPVAAKVFYQYFVFSQSDIEVTLSIDSMTDLVNNPRIEILNTNNQLVGYVGSIGNVPKTSVTATGCKIRLNWSTAGAISITKPMIETGSTATSFEPYANVCPISGTDELTLKHDNDNMLSLPTFDFTIQGVRVYTNEDGNVVLNGTSVGGISPNNALWTNNLRFSLPKGHYYLSCNSFSAYGAVVVVKNTDTNTVICQFNSNWQIDLTETTPMSIGIYIPEDKTFDNFVCNFEASLDNITYDVPNRETYTFDLGQEVMGGTADCVGGVGEKTYKKITLNGSESWGNYSARSGFYLDIEDMRSMTASLDCFCDWLKPTQSWTEELGIRFGQANNRIYCLQITNNISDVTSVTTWKQYLNDHPLTICYPLATPTDFTFTGQPINSYLGVNNVWTDSGEVLDVEYRSNF